MPSCRFQACGRQPRVVAIWDDSSWTFEALLSCCFCADGVFTPRL